MRRQDSFPWIIVMGGAVLYWTIALGVGIPSLYRVLGEPGPARRPTPTETRCVQSVTVDGTPVTFGDCINVRLLDPSELPQPDRVIRYHPNHDMTPSHVFAGPDPEVNDPVWNPTPLEHPRGKPRRAQLEPSDPIGRTAY
jgi:hypothetical protein